MSIAQQKKLNYKEALNQLNKGKKIRLSDQDGWFYKTPTGKLFRKNSDGTQTELDAIREDWHERKDWFVTEATFTNGEDVMFIKDMRKRLDGVLQHLHAVYPSRERALSVTKIQEGIMWLGMDLKRLGEANPYPTSKDPSSTKVEPTADGLKF